MVPIASTLPYGTVAEEESHATLEYGVSDKHPSGYKLFHISRGQYSQEYK